MKTVRSLDEARRLALTVGAELQAGGTLFNSTRAQVAKPAPAPRPEPSAPAPAPAEPTFTRAEVEQLIAANNARMHEMFAKAIASLSAQRPAAPVQPAQWDFDIVENSEGAIVHVTARAKS